MSQRRQQQSSNVSVGRILEKATQLLAFGAVASVIIFVFRALWVAGMNPHVASALVVNTPLSTTFQAMALDLMSTLSYVGACLLFWISAKPLREVVGLTISDKDSGRSIIERFADSLSGLMLPLLGLLAGIMLVWMVVLRLPAGGWQVAVIGVIVVVVPPIAILVIRFLAGRKQPISKKLAIIGKLSLAYGVIGGAASLFIALTSQTMWLPPEQIDTKQGSLVMYVLQDSNDELVAFIPANRAVVRIPASEVRKRQYCLPFIEVDVSERIWDWPDMPFCHYNEEQFYPYTERMVDPSSSSPEPPDQLP